jgi:outer membrane receptor protein involved in Fe transport
MKKITVLLTIILIPFLTIAQFPGGGGGGMGRERGSQGNMGQPNMNRAQAKGTAKITGTVNDSLDAKAVEFASVALYTKADNKLIDGTITDDKGKFELVGLGDGVYRIQITFMGYDLKVLDDIKIVNERNINLGTIKLPPSSKTLDEVTVTGQKAMIEEKVDRLVYNAEKDQLAKGGDAADVLRKVPLLQVDLEGNVSVRGSSNIRVLINNKPSTIMASSVADALKQIPADMIKTVEVITSPSAKYDAEGSGGIINIITKKDKLQGYNLGVDLGAGLRGSNVGVNGSYRSGKFGLTLGGFGRAFYNKAETDMEQVTTVAGVQNKTLQESDATDNGLFGHYNLGMDYDIDKTQTLTGNVRYGMRGFNRTQLQSTDIFKDNVMFSSAYRDIDSRDASNNIDVNLDYLKTYKDQKEWSVAAQYSRNNLTNNFNSDNLNQSSEIINRLKNINSNINQEVTLQTDYQTPIGTRAILEMGAKGIFRTVNSDYQYLLAKDAFADYTQDFTRPAGVLDYNQNVMGAYTSMTYTTKNKITLKAGARYELTAIDATQDNKDIDIPNYSNLVPSVNISKTLKNNATVKMGYNRRIQRPGLQQLNPNFNIVNTQDIRVGNPSLSPELTDNIELSMSRMIKKTYLNASVFGRFTNNSINQVRRPYDSIAGAILTTYENIGVEKSYGTNIFTNIYLTNTWSINGGFDMYYSFLEGQTTGLDGKSITVKNDGFNFGGRLMSQLQLKNGWGIQAFTFMRGRRVELQGVRGGHGMYSMGVRKDFKNKKGSIGMSVENFAQKGWNIKSEYNTPQFTQVSNNLMLNRNIKINLNYKFGKMTFTDSRKKTRGIRNDDVKDGGGDGGGGNAGGGEGGAAPQGQGARPQQGQGAPTGQPNKGGTTDMKKPQNNTDKTKVKPEEKPTKGEEPKKNGNQ